MIKEDFCSQELYNLLIEKGFEVSSYDAPFTYRLVTHQSAMKWLREVHNILIVISITYEKERYDWYICGIKGDPWEKKLFQEEKDVTYATYEEAVEAALKYVLEKFDLIWKIKHL